MSDIRVVITGIGFVSPIGNDSQTVLESLRLRRHGLERVNWFPNCPVQVAGTIKDFDLSQINRLLWKWPSRYDIPRETVRSLPPHGHCFCALEQAIADANLTPKDLASPETGLFCASAGSPRYLRHGMNETVESNGQRITPWGVLSTISGTLNFNLAAFHRIQGAVTGFSSASVASTHALGYARDEIASGQQRRMLVVAGEDPVWESLLPFAGMRALSKQEDPSLASRPLIEIGMGS